MLPKDSVLTHGRFASLLGHLLFFNATDGKLGRRSGGGEGFRSFLWIICCFRSASAALYLRRGGSNSAKSRGSYLSHRPILFSLRNDTVPTPQCRTASGSEIERDRVALRMETEEATVVGASFYNLPDFFHVLFYFIGVFIGFTALSGWVSVPSTLLALLILCGGIFFLIQCSHLFRLVLIF